MKDVKREFGVIGLGRMGGNLSLNALEKGIRVVGYDIRGASQELLRAGLVEAKSLQDFRENLSPPRAVSPVMY